MRRVKIISSYSSVEELQKKIDEWQDKTGFDALETSLSYYKGRHSISIIYNDSKQEREEARLLKS